MTTLFTTLCTSRCAPNSVEGGAYRDFWQDRLSTHCPRPILGGGPSGTRDNDQRGGEAEAGRFVHEDIAVPGIILLYCSKVAVLQQRRGFASDPFGAKRRPGVIVAQRAPYDVESSEKCNPLPLRCPLGCAGVRLEQRYRVSFGHLFAFGGAQKPRRHLPHMWSRRGVR